MDIEIIGFLAGLFTTIAIVPQIIKAYRTKKVAHLSPVFFSILLIGVFLWSLYGFLKEDYPIIITNSISFLLNGYMLFLYFKYK